MYSKAKFAYYSRYFLTEDEMVGWGHQLSSHELELALGVGDGPGGLV